MNRAGSARMLVLALWSAFFAWLLITGEVCRYIGPKTRWVVGSEAAVRKSTGLVGASSFIPVPQPNGEVSFPEIKYASESQQYAAEAGIVEGYEIKLTGFVTHPDGGREGTLALTRFASFCCAADAVPYSVTVDPGGEDYPDDTWLTISGSLVNEGGEFVLKAQRITETVEPDSPFI